MTLPENKKIFTSSYQQYTSECLNSLQTHSLQPNLTKKWVVLNFQDRLGILLEMKLSPGVLPNTVKGCLL